MNPFTVCERIYSKHFADRMTDRYLKDHDVSVALEEGTRNMESKGKYEIQWNRWTIIVSLGKCCIIMITAYRE